MNTEQGGPSSVTSTGKLRPSKRRAWSRSASYPGWSLSSVCISCRPLFFGDLRVSAEESREREGLLRRDAPSRKACACAGQDGGGVAAVQGRGTQPHAHAQVSLATVSRATTKDPRPIKLASSSNECPLLFLGLPFPQSGPHLDLPTPSSPIRTPCILPGSQRRLSAAGLGVPRAPWSCGRPDSTGPALHCRDGRGGGVLRLRTDRGRRGCHSTNEG